MKLLQYPKILLVHVNSHLLTIHTIGILGSIACPRHIVRDNIRSHVGFHESFFNLRVDDVRLELFLHPTVDACEVPTYGLAKLVHDCVRNVEYWSEGDFIFAPNEVVEVLTHPITLERVHQRRLYGNRSDIVWWFLWWSFSV